MLCQDRGKVSYRPTKPRAQDHLHHTSSPSSFFSVAGPPAKLQAEDLPLGLQDPQQPPPALRGHHDVIVQVAPALGAWWTLITHNTCMCLSHGAAHAGTRLSQNNFRKQGKTICLAERCAWSTTQLPSTQQMCRAGLHASWPQGSSRESKCCGPTLLVNIPVLLITSATDACASSLKECA